ncbi:MAG: NAD(P)H-hydrate dehydratase [Candidatus Saliniplasma sp.]
MLQFQEVAVLDRNSDFRGVPPKRLMENAGKKLAEEIHQRYPEERIIFLCGTGNNGGDGYVAARYLSEWRGKEDITVYLIKGLKGVRSELAKNNLDRLECEIVDEIDRDVMQDKIVVDALLGTGIKGDIREPYRSLIECVNETVCRVVSVDIPSGLGTDINVEPELTVTFHDKKVGMDESSCGEIIVKDIGIPEEAEKFTGPGELLLYPTPDDVSHKGDNGRLLIIGGGPYTGAPALAGIAAYRVGVDLVRLAVPGSVKNVVAGFSPNFIVHPLKGEKVRKKHVDKILQLSKESDAVLLGPGLGDDQATLKACRDFIKRLKKPLVLDADGLKAVVDNPELLPKDTILTPHAGEISRFEIKNDVTESAEELAQEYDITVLLKGNVDYITDGQRIKRNDFGTPAMTVGGTGDTLAGVVSGLFSKGMDPFDAARVGAYITCRAGELAFEDLGWGTMPEDISERFYKVLKDYK